MNLESGTRNPEPGTWNPHPLHSTLNPQHLTLKPSPTGYFLQKSGLIYVTHPGYYLQFKDLIMKNSTIKSDYQTLIYDLRGYKVMLDFDLATLYGVETKRLKEQVRRNLSRFPEDFMFVLNHEEMDNLRPQIATSSWEGTR